MNPLPAPSPGAARLALALLAVLGLFLAPLFAPPEAINGDTSWLIHVVERLMNGGRAYVDVVETNPPMAFLIYWPGVAAAKIAGVRPELAVIAFAGLVAAASSMLALAIARRTLGMAPLGVAVLGAALVVAFALLPSKSFTQREHLALMLLLPAALLLAARSGGRVPSLAFCLAAGAMAGLGASIKPHFTLVVALPALTAAALRRDWRILFAPEALIAAALFLIYALFWFAAYPEFFGTPLFLIQNSYRLYALRPAEYLQDTSAAVFLFACAMALALALLLRTYAEILTFAAAMLAFAVAFVEQGKGFAYHLYPVAAMGLLLAAFAMALGRPERDGRLPALRGLILLAAAALSSGASGLYSALYPDSSGLRQALLNEKPRPKLIIIGFDIAVNFPLARNIGATWASRLQSTWISNSASHAMERGIGPEQRVRTDRAVAIERDWLAEDITRNRPDLVVFDRRAMLDHMRAGESFRAAFDPHYEQAGSAQDGRFLIFRRKAG